MVLQWSVSFTISQHRISAPDWYVWTCPCRVFASPISSVYKRLRRHKLRHKNDTSDKQVAREPCASKFVLFADSTPLCSSHRLFATQITTRQQIHVYEIVYSITRILQRFDHPLVLLFFLPVCARWRSSFEHFSISSPHTALFGSLILQMA